MSFSPENINALMRPRKVCLCKGVSKEDIIKTVKDGATRMGQVVKKTHATTGCGTCFLDVKELVQQTLDEVKKEKDPQAELPLDS